MKTAELTGALLDYWVARAEGYTIRNIHPGKPEYAESSHPDIWYWLDYFRPSTQWAQGGPLIEKYKVELRIFNGFNTATTTDMRFDKGNGFGDTPLQAICRAVVRAAFGDEVEKVAV